MFENEETAGKTIKRKWSCKINRPKSMISKYYIIFNVRKSDNLYALDILRRQCHSNLYEKKEKI